MVYISKSKYCQLLQCPKMLWLSKYKPQVETQDSTTEGRLNSGNEVGDLAMGLFGDFVEVTRFDDEGDIDISAMIDATRVEIERGTPVICEASFAYGGLYCAVDILKKEANGYAIYEVKSSTKESVVYAQDISFQRYVLSLCGINVVGTYLVTLNPDYVFDGELKLEELFIIHNMNKKVDKESWRILPALDIAERILSSEEEPQIDLSEGCNAPYPCAFFNYCTKHLPTPSVFDLYRLPFKSKLEYYKNGLIDFPSILASGKIKGEKQNRQLEYATSDMGTYVDKEKIKDFLDTLSYPIYFLDFETLMSSIPLYIGTRPYQQIPFQYSLHYIDAPGGELCHKEFLGEPQEDPRRALALRLCQDIPEGACVTAYNKSFECTVIRTLAKDFPELADRLITIADSIVDLLTPFRSGYYYNARMGGNFSIKSVLPAIYPNDPSLDYHTLEGVHNGSEAMSAYPAMVNMSISDRATMRKNLLEYCKLDTYAMVKVWEELVRVASDSALPSE